jgi:hypothetical protein
MGARGSEIRPISGIPQPPKWREMTVVAPGDQPDTPGEVHGKEGVSGSIPIVRQMGSSAQSRRIARLKSAGSICHPAP